MSSKTKIFVFKMRNLIYTGIFVGLAILLVILLVVMFKGKNSDSEDEHELTYVPGVYTSSIMLSNQAIDVEVSVDGEHINSVRFVNLDEAITTMYPLMESVMSNISTQVCEKQSTAKVSYSTDTQYTSMALLKAINTAIDKAKTGENAQPATTAVPQTTAAN